MMVVNSGNYPRFFDIDRTISILIRHKLKSPFNNITVTSTNSYKLKIK